MSSNEQKKHHPIRNLGIAAVALAAVIGGCAGVNGGGDDSSSASSSTSTATGSAATTASAKPAAKVTTKAAPKQAESSSHLTFTVTSKTAETADVTLTYSNDKGGQVQKQETVKLPFKKVVDFKRYTLKPSGANILAQAGDGGTDITTAVAWNDDEPSTGEGSGEYATATAVLQ